MPPIRLALALAGLLSLSACATPASEPRPRPPANRPPNSPPPRRRHRWKRRPLPRSPP